MAEIRVTRVEKGETRVRSVPIAVTPEGFWCCPSPVGFQKNLKPQNPLNKPKLSSPPKKPSERKPPSPPPAPPEAPAERAPALAKPRKVAIEFGEAGTSDMKVVLLGKQGFCVKMSVHRSVLADSSGFFAGRIAEMEIGSSCMEIDGCDDVEIYVETVGLMYCKDMKQRLIKQSVSRVLRILNVAELIGFKSCINSCLEYLEAVPWVGEEEEDRVVSSVLRLQGEGVRVSPVLKRVSSDAPKPQKDTRVQITELVLRSTDERSRREMKSVVLKLLSESDGESHVAAEAINGLCRGCLDLLLVLFKQEPDDEPVRARGIALESDNLAWLLEILAGMRAADAFAATWAGQHELATLHGILPVTSRHHVSSVSARVFVGVGRGEVMPSKDTRRLLVETWLQPLIADYAWLQHGCGGPFDRRAVDEGVGRTILTLPLDEQRSILLSWLGNFLRAGDNCPNLQRAFEVWWRRTFVRPETNALDFNY